VAGHPENAAALGAVMESPVAGRIAARHDPVPRIAWRPALNG